MHKCIFVHNITQHKINWNVQFNQYSIFKMWSSTLNPSLKFISTLFYSLSIYSWNHSSLLFMLDLWGKIFGYPRYLFYLFSFCIILNVSLFFALNSLPVISDHSCSCTWCPVSTQLLLSWYLPSNFYSITQVLGHVIYIYLFSIWDPHYKSFFTIYNLIGADLF